LNDPSPTETACQWKRAPGKSLAAPVLAIQFFKPDLTKEAPKPSTAAPRPVPTCTDDQLSGFLRNVKTLAPDTLIFQVMTDSEDTDTASETEEEQEHVEGAEMPCPQPTCQLVKVSSMYHGLSEVEAKKVGLTTADCKHIGEATREQSASSQWFDQREGRITASILKSVMSCSTGIEGVLSDVMGYSTVPDVPSIQWGREAEPKARAAFAVKESRKHEGFQVRMSGLVVMPEKPFLGASPDGIVSCSCCGSAVLEVKCPLSLKYATFAGPVPFLDEDMHLNKCHAYYAQVQMQMALLQLPRTFFVVYSTRDLYIDVVSFDALFWSDAVKIAERFFYDHVLSEMQTSCLARKIERAKMSCSCQGAKSGRMVECMSCSEIFHIQCVQLKRTPKAWFCEACVML
ncbi:unnamed protein product, partial [Ixodes hexagonus]